MYVLIVTVVSSEVWIYLHYILTCPVLYCVSSDPFYIVGYFIKWVTTSWTYSKRSDSYSAFLWSIVLSAPGRLSLFLFFLFLSLTYPTISRSLSLSHKHINTLSLTKGLPDWLHHVIKVLQNRVNHRILNVISLSLSPPLLSLSQTHKNSLTYPGTLWLTPSCYQSTPE